MQYLLNDKIAKGESKINTLTKENYSSFKF